MSPLRLGASSSLVSNGGMGLDLPNLPLGKDEQFPVSDLHRFEGDDVV